ncbi:MAG: twitching motility protein PilT, partial [Planctomycetes bacterium]|nr:twitching motility protein PilT [Planctomycetota bacterium]
MDLLPLLSFMHRQGASDLHLSTGVPPIVRVHGEMKRTTAPPLTADQLLPMLHGIMAEPQRREFEERLETDFSFSTDFARFRVNAFTQRHGPAAVLRRIPTEVLPLERLGLPPIVGELAMKERGLILVTGPTGSGKSTTLASIIDYINERSPDHIITIEDPIEFVH